MSAKRVARRTGQVFWYKGDLYMRVAQCTPCVLPGETPPIIFEHNAVVLSGNLSGELRYIPMNARVEPINIGEPQWTVTSAV
jgi:hypothetical protein